MATQRRRSSLGRMLSSFMVNRINTVADSFDLTSTETDLLISYQFTLPEPLFLGPEALLAARLVNTGQLSHRIHATLVKLQIINAPPPTTTDDYLPVNTNNITKEFPNQLYFCTAHTHRRIVALLFVFEEQCFRWKSIRREQYEIEQLLQDPPTGLRQELEVRLQSTKQRFALLPSQQNESSESPDDLPPAYTSV